MTPSDPPNSSSESPSGNQAGNDALAKPTSRVELASFIGKATIFGLRHRRDFHDVEKVFFLVGYPRSGSTLIGSMLNAHPEMVIAHESDLFRYVRPGVGRSQLFAILLLRDRQFAEVERQWNGFDYALDSGNQGQFLRLRVIGDKHAGRAARRLHEDRQLLDRLRRIVEVPIRSLHIVRNPYDNIASIAHNRNLPLERAIDIYRRLGVAVDDVRDRLHPDEVFEVRYEDFTADAAKWLTDTCHFAGVDAPDEYVEACAALADPGGRRSRSRFTWSQAELEAVQDMITSRSVLAGYRFDD
jgi:Sulfotransferase family